MSIKKQNLRGVVLLFSANLEESVAISSSGGLVVKIPAAIVDCAYSDKNTDLRSNTDISKKFCRDITESRNNLSAYRIIKDKRQKIVQEAQKEIIDKVKKISVKIGESWKLIWQVTLMMKDNWII